MSGWSVAGGKIPCSHIVHESRIIVVVEGCSWSIADFCLRVLQNIILHPNLSSNLRKTPLYTVYIFYIYIVYTRGHQSASLIDNYLTFSMNTNGSRGTYIDQARVIDRIRNYLVSQRWVIIFFFFTIHIFFLYAFLIM